MEEFLEVAKVGTTLIHGPPGAGKTSLAMVLASRIANKVMWVSTTEGPNMLKVVADRLNVKKEKIDFLDFPRSFRENIVRYIVDHIQQYEALVIDSINGLARQQEIDLLT
ncbi:MAG: AAA family ATPase, partial [Pyrobaculum sp.]